jgi:hypothetical protein
MILFQKKIRVSLTRLFIIALAVKRNNRRWSTPIVYTINNEWFIGKTPFVQAINPVTKANWKAVGLAISECCI